MANQINRDDVVVTFNGSVDLSPLGIEYVSSERSPKVRGSNITVRLVRREFTFTLSDDVMEDGAAGAAGVLERAFADAKRALDGQELKRLLSTDNRADMRRLLFESGTVGGHAEIVADVIANRYVGEILELRTPQTHDEAAAYERIATLLMDALKRSGIAI